MEEGQGINLPEETSRTQSVRFFQIQYYVVICILNFNTPADKVARKKNTRTPKAPIFQFWSPRNLACGHANSVDYYQKAILGEKLL